MNRKPNTALKAWQRMVYGLPYLGYSIATLPVIAFIPGFYETERGLNLAAIGLMIALTRVTDAFTDPLIGWISDRLRTPIGRRKPVILVGLPLMCLAVWMLFVPPDDVRLSYVFIWSALLYLGFTLVDLPFKALGAELSPYYDERASIAGWREGMGLIGMLLGFVAASYVALAKDGGLGDQLYIMAIIAVIATPLLFTLSMCLLREPTPALEKKNVSVSVKIRQVWRNGMFKILLLISLVLVASEFGASALKALIFEHIFFRPDLFPVLLLSEIMTMVISIPFWLCGSLAIFFALSLLKATSVGAITVLANGMAADVIDIDEARTGETRTGIYFAFWGMVNKGAVAIGVLVATNLPGLMGYQVLDTGAQGTWTLIWTYGFLTGIGFLAISPVIFRWRLTRKRQDRIRAAIKRRNTRLAKRPEA